MKKFLIILSSLILFFANVSVKAQTSLEKPLMHLMPRVGIDGILESQSLNKNEKYKDEILKEILADDLNKKVKDKKESKIKLKAEDQTVQTPKTKPEPKLENVEKIKTEDKSTIEPEKKLIKSKNAKEQKIDIKEKPQQPEKQINNENKAEIITQKNISDESEKTQTNPDDKNNINKTKNTSDPLKLISDKKINPKAETQGNIIIPSKQITYADLDMQKIADEIKADIDDEREIILADLRILWQGAVEKSETIRFAILKLSNPDGEKDKKSIVKKILSPLTSVAPLVGMGSGDPLAGGSAIIGSGLLSSLLADDSLINQELSRVTDIDLVVMAQEIDNLQQKLVVLYYNYLSAVERLYLMDNIVGNRYRYYMLAHDMPNEVLSIADVFYREALDMQYKARQEVLSSRASLEQLVGNDALIQVDKNIKERLVLN